ncbi:MAG: glycerol-3-phosphate acyltransferase, partial [Bacteroidales bacterium]|nr:glycerol-3-phosphate acyltransferase [Bacteroidales bacterium]
MEYTAIIIIICLAIAAYLMGSFSSALWFGKWFYKIDIREHGSKNAGSTNVLRVLGWKCAIPVFIVDILKSFIPTMFFVMILNSLALNGTPNELIVGTESYYLFQLLFGIAAIIGHILPIFSRFKGGKGVASMLGL